MIGRWNDDHLREFAKRHDPRGELERGVIEQAYSTTLLGADNDLTMHGGGNTSVKTGAVDSMGKPRRALYVKASGTPLDAFTPDHFVVMDLDGLEGMRTKSGLDDEEMAREFKRHKLLGGDMLPSIESLMHAFVPAKIVSHTHPAALLKIVNRAGGAEVLRECFGDDLAVVPYARMGYDLAKAVSDAALENMGRKGVVMRHHGLIAWGESPREVYDKTIDIVTRAEEFLAGMVVRPLKSDPYSNQNYNSLPIKSTSCVRLNDPDTMELINSAEAKSIICDPPLTPDYPMLERIHLRWVDGDADDTITEDDTLPLAVVRPGSGVYCYGADDKSARKTADLTRQALSIRRAVFETGGVYEALAEEFVSDMQYRAYNQGKTTRG